MILLRLGEIDAGIGGLCHTSKLMSIFPDDARILPYMVMFGDSDWAAPQHFGGHFCRAFSPKVHRPPIDQSGHSVTNCLLRTLHVRTGPNLAQVKFCPDPSKLA